MRVQGVTVWIHAPSISSAVLLYRSNKLEDWSVCDTVGAYARACRDRIMLHCSDTIRASNNAPHPDATSFLCYRECRIFCSNLRGQKKPRDFCDFLPLAADELGLIWLTYLALTCIEAVFTGLAAESKAYRSVFPANPSQSPVLLVS